MRVVKQISFNSIDHADILAWLDKQDNESAATREAIREKMGVSLGDVYRKLAAVEQELQTIKASGIASTGPAPDPLPVEDTTAAAALDDLLGI